MRRFAFIIAILGILVLAILMNLPPKEISDKEELSSLEINQKVSIQGKVTSERILYENQKLLVLDNKIELVCECPSAFKDKNISVLGIISEYDGKKQVTVLRIIS
jgi:hypothetical protein